MLTKQEITKCKLKKRYIKKESPSEQKSHILDTMGIKCEINYVIYDVTLLNSDISGFLHVTDFLFSCLEDSL